MEDYRELIDGEKKLLKRVVGKIIYCCISPIITMLDKKILQNQQLATNQMQEETSRNETLTNNLQSRLQTLEDNVRNNNDRIEILSRASEEEYGKIDYFDFENRFRGSIEEIKKRQNRYIKYFEGRSQVVDLGCGRGEMLELMKENSISAIGVDVYLPFVEFCRDRGLNVMQGDCIEYLGTRDIVDGVFAGQLVEHLSYAQIIYLCEVAFQKMEKGAYLILETPNPETLAIFSHAFYIDPSHKKPIHPFTLKYIVEKIGFSEVYIDYTPESKYPVEIPLLDGDGIDNKDAFNESMREVSLMLFGSQDYAIIAKK